MERLDTSRLAERRGPAELERRLDRVEQQLDGLLGKLDVLLDARPAGPRASRRREAAGAPKPKRRPS